MEGGEGEGREGRGKGVGEGMWLVKAEDSCGGEGGWGEGWK